MNNIFQKANCESSVNYIDFKCKISNGKINKSVQKKLIPDFTKPMLCQTKDLPFDHPDWIFENKYDGLRVIIKVEKNKCKIYTKNKISIENNYPEIKNQLEKLEVDLMLDGEIAVEDEYGITRFQLLQNLENNLKSAKFFAFDICYLNGYKLTDLPLVLRKDILQNIFQNKEFKSIKLSPFIKAEGKKFFNEIKNRNGEGIIAKDAFSLYHPGTRTKSWLKIKNLHEQEAVILGFTQPQGERKFFGSIILGIKKNKKWIYIGHCATGFTNVMLENLYKKFSNSLSYDTPFHIPLKLENKIQWVKPKYVCQIQFNEWTEEGLMRQPVFIDIKKNKSIKEIKLEVSENK